MSDEITVIGGGLAGCEAAWQLARAGLAVRLVEMKPKRRTEAQVTDHLAELVCSNSLRSANVLNAVGLLKEEMRRLNSLVISAALEAKVPAGDALAVDRERFAQAIEGALDSEALITRVAEIATELPARGDAIVCTGPLTASELADDIIAKTGKERLYFYDAIAPIVAGDSIDENIAFAQSRYDKGAGADYLNCPFTEDEYNVFYDALIGAECLPLHEFEKPKYFQGCLPIEVVAASGRQSLLFGSMKPVGLTDPRTGSRPFAVVQLRKEDIDGQAYNLVGFQTKLKYPEQKRVFSLIPGLKHAEWHRLGAIHRNTYIDAPTLLDERLRFRQMPHIRFAGQITGVEGYVESAACGLVAGRLLAADRGALAFTAPPRETALGALLAHVGGEGRIAGRPHEPQNVNWGMFSAMPRMKKQQIRIERAKRALRAFEKWASSACIAVADAHIVPEDLDREGQSMASGGG